LGAEKKDMAQTYRFENELELIVDSNIREFTKKCLGKAPEYFWTIPSSSTGKHHPPDENSEGGAVLHVRKAVKIAEDLCIMYNISGITRDCIISATIMHDLAKLGYPNQELYTVNGHGALWIRIAEQIEKPQKIMTSDTLSMIGRLIGCHMGRFDIPYTISNSDKPTLIVQLADYISSRKYISIDLNGEDH
jgi:23S rRNA maturation-related 3'-5' exoribonuclease YhaM